MKKFMVTVISIFLLVPIVLAVIGYTALNVKYEDTYMFGIFINDIYATDMTPAQVNEQLMEYVEIGDFTVVTRDGSEITFPLSDFGYSYSYMEELTALQKADTPIKWVKRMLEKEGKFTDYTVSANGVYDKAQLEKYLADFTELEDRSDMSDLKVEIIKGVNGYELLDDTIGLLDGDKARKVISKAIAEGKSTVDLWEEACYIQADYTPQMKETLAIWDKVDALQSCEITYIFENGDVVVDASVVADWIILNEDGSFAFDEEGKLQISEEAVETFIAQLANVNDTYGKSRVFHTTRGDNVLIERSNYGDMMDQKTEIAYLLEAVYSGLKEEHVPSYLQRAFASGEDDIGDTYIEIDMTNQTMYYYKNGKCALETPVVTGNTSLGRGTPQRICYVYSKERNRVLRGEDYASFVSYWMPVYKGIGIHDASWRGKFGGTIYKTNGSHGCINTPTKAVSQLYDMVEIGTPVIIFY